MACNENVVKNMANEIARNCQAQNVTVDPEFVIYMIDLLLLNPKYGKLFSKTLNRNNLQYFVEECVSMLTRGDTSIKTLKMQFIIQTNYDKLQNLIDKHLDSIDKCLRPLLSEILESDPDPDDEEDFKKLFRKISIYIILASGLGNPGHIVTLKEGMSALESVFSLDDLKVFVALPRDEKITQLNELLEITSGVRLFNRDCKKGGEGIPDLPFNLVDAGKACLASLSNSLITVMQRVNSLTTAIGDTVHVHDETGNVLIDVPSYGDLTVDDFKEIFELLAFNRQYEVFIRKLLSDVETMVAKSTQYVENVRSVLDELHAAVKYKAAVPVVAVFPLFTKLWRVWRAMQSVLYLVSTAGRLAGALAALHDLTRVPHEVLALMLTGKHVVSDQERVSRAVSMEERMSLGFLTNYVAFTGDGMRERQIQYLGFCALCLTVGALVPCNMKVGIIKDKGLAYGFCSPKMAAKFSKDPQRYINEVLDFARNHPHVINLLNLVESVHRVKDVDTLVTIYLPEVKVFDKDIQTEAHPIDEHIEKNYSWNLWDWKRRACQWATIANSKTHSTQTHYSHMRSEIHCQTFEPRDKCLQTKKDCGVNTASNNTFIWGLRGQLGYGQHAMDLGEKHSPERKKAQDFTVCHGPCLGSADTAVSSISSSGSQRIDPDDAD